MNRHAYFRQQEKNYLAHHGIKGQKWGIRRYQNPDGSLTEEGKRRYGISEVDNKGKGLSKDIKKYAGEFRTAKELMVEDMITHDVNDLVNNYDFYKDYCKLYNDIYVKGGAEDHDDMQHDLEKLVNKKYPQYKDILPAIWDTPDSPDPVFMAGGVNDEWDNWLGMNLDTTSVYRDDYTYASKANAILAATAAKTENELSKKYGEQITTGILETKPSLFWNPYKTIKE